MSPTLNRYTILQTIATHKKQFVSCGVFKLRHFGSFVRNQANQDSDIDFSVDKVKEEKAFQNFLTPNYYLEDIFCRKVDLITIQSLCPFIGPYISKTTEYVPVAY